MKKSYRIFLEILLMVGIFLLLWQIVLGVESYQIGNFADPLASLYFFSGWVSIGFLVASLVVFKAIKKSFGLLALVSALVHSGIFFAIDFDWNFLLIVEELKSKYYLYFGFLSFVLLWICFLFGGYFYRLKLYYAVYVAIVFALIHLLLIQKILSLSYLLSAFVILLILSFKVVMAFKKG
ncbi:cytochrome b family protein [Helicobacter mesocricetorum]|uniref:hypothetical protein n=1 Tax=Helicobacter mesocricetorum TaxID=87012 RepID=UPI000CF1118E|nr:hypothetical protein [Helicobacter mesocricetorum]